MSDDNLGNFFQADNFNDKDDESNSENWKAAKIYGNALFKKGIDILNITQTICDLLPDNEEGEITRSLMLENAMIVPAKIKGAMAVNDVYCIAMESAVMIKVNICQLKDQLWTCNAIHNIDEHYLVVLKDELEAFKKIFIKWVTSFDKENDLPDEWHLFNDPATFPGPEE